MLALIALTFAVAPGPALDARANGDELVVNEVRVHRFATSRGRVQPEARARAAAETLQAWTPGTTFTVRPQGRDARVVAGPRTVLTVTPAEAKALGTTPPALAASIRQRLADSTALPPLRPDALQVSTAPDRPIEVRLLGSQARKAKVQARPEGVLRVERTLGQLRFVPLRAGTAEVTIGGATEAVSIAVAVMPYAITPGREYQATVTGNPASAETVAGAAMAAVQSDPALSGAVAVRALGVDATPIAVGQAATARVRVRAEGAGHTANETVVPVKVKNTGVLIGREDELWYSNAPENVDRPQRLYWGRLAPGRAVRLLYHHKNVTQGPLVVRFMVANPTDTPARVATLLGDAEPALDPTKVGYEAGERFWPLWLVRSAEVVTVPPQSVVPLCVRLTRPEETMSGLATLQLLPGGPDQLVLVGESVLPTTGWDNWAAAQRHVGAWRVARPRSLVATRLELTGVAQNVFPDPFRPGRFEYRVGERFGHLRIGEQGVANQPGDGVLFGNFGVVYEIEGTVENPGPSPVEVELVYEASAGYAGVLFVMGGRLVRGGMLLPKETTVIATIKVPAGERRDVSLKTMPLSGANYPGTLTVRPVGIELGTVTRKAETSVKGK